MPSHSLVASLPVLMVGEGFAFPSLQMAAERSAKILGRLFRGTGKVSALMDSPSAVVTRIQNLSKGEMNAARKVRGQT